MWLIWVYIGDRELLFREGKGVVLIESVSGLQIFILVLTLWQQYGVVFHHLHSLKKKQNKNSGKNR